ncbi:peptide chain release factor N(5)-glutamine methyltransferase [soil metagenome]
MNISKAISSASTRLEGSGVANPRREASSLLAFVLQRDLTFQIAHPEYELTVAELDAFDLVVGRRVDREPFQYIVGHQEFYGLDFDVGPSVLIPRPETEILVEAAIEVLSERDNPFFLELGVGSGCISVSILHNIETARSVGVDISQEALDIASDNAEKHGVVDRMTLEKADLFNETTGEFDLIVSNPPYVPTIDLETMQVEVAGFEPHTALFGGPDGLEIVKRVVDGAPDFLRPQGYLLIEIGFGQSENVKELYDPAVWDFVEFIPDLQGIPRIVKSCLRG